MNANFLSYISTACCPEKIGTVDTLDLAVYLFRRHIKYADTHTANIETTTNSGNTIFGWQINTKKESVTPSKSKAVRPPRLGHLAEKNCECA